MMEQPKEKQVKRMNQALIAAAGIAFLVAVWTAVGDQMKGGTDGRFLILLCLLLAALFVISPLKWAKDNGMFAADDDDASVAIIQEHELEGAHGGSDRENILIWGGLLVLTAIEVGLGYIQRF